MATERPLLQPFAAGAAEAALVAVSQGAGDESS